MSRSIRRMRGQRMQALLLHASLLAAFSGAAFALPPQSAVQAPVPAGAPAAQADAKAETITTPIPWKPGLVLRYATEHVESDSGPGKREKAVTTGKAEIRTVAVDKDGVLQHWVGTDSHHEYLEGGDEGDRAVAAAMRQLDGVPLKVALDPDGSFKALVDVEDIAARMRAALRPVMVAQVQDGIGKAVTDPAQRPKAEAEAVARLDAVLAKTTSTQVLGALLARQPSYYAFFTGGGVEDGASYETATEIENPLQVGNFPATMTFGMYVSEDDPEDVIGEWKVEIDPVKGAGVLLATMERLYDRKITAAEREALPETISVVDSGFVVIHRGTGVVEMYEDERTTKFGQNANYERSRMQLLEGGHGHEWKAEIPQATDPALSASEHEGMACADAGGDIMAGIAACTRLLDAQATTDKQRAMWLAARAGFRLREDKPGLAKADLDHAIKLRPEDGDLYHARAVSHLRLKDHAAALADADASARLQPESLRAQMARGAALEGLKKFRDADAAYGQAIALAPNNAAGHDARCWVRAMLSEFDAGRSDCDRAIALAPDGWNAYNSRAYIHYRSGRHREAVADDDRSIALNPGIASSWHVRGLAKRALGDEAGAKPDFDKAQALDPGVAERYRGYEAPAGSGGR
ncbi:MAG: tetratricopeptide repeat protein [Xanthomonadales bacterium]|nr:tetratricopeptide repeat protein [Xanthomonadales bacterium]